MVDAGGLNCNLTVKFINQAAEFPPHSWFLPLIYSQKMLAFWLSAPQCPVSSFVSRYSHRLCICSKFTRISAPTVTCGTFNDGLLFHTSFAWLISSHSLSAFREVLESDKSMYCLVCPHSFQRIKHLVREDWRRMWSPWNLYIYTYIYVCVCVCVCSSI
jgi:hypothetical protein